MIQHIYVVRRGQFSIYDDNQGKPQLGGHIKAGEVFGGITLLMNAGVSLRTVQVDQETEAYLIPRETFLDLCARHKDFYSFFIENFSQHISDPALDTIIISGQAKLFLSSVEPFSMLPDDAMEQVSRELAMVFHKKGAILFSQEELGLDICTFCKKDRGNAISSRAAKNRCATSWARVISTAAFPCCSTMGSPFARSR
jgi:CBS domain-containing protein